MRTELRLAVLAAALGFAAAGCGGGREALKIGVLTDCQGVFSAYSEDVLAAAELPFLERGARLSGEKPSDGISAAKVGGVPVRIETGCAEVTDLTALIESTRRLVEREHVDAVVGPMLGETDGLVLRSLAQRYPSVTFLLGDSMAQEATLRDPAPNVFRFGPDEAQATAGLGSYAFHRLGWRRAAIVVRDSGQTWPQAAGFVAEFCSLGGKVDRVPIPASGPARAATAIPKGVDGVVALTGFVGETAAFVGAYAPRQPDLARHLLLGPNSLIFADRKTLTALGTSLNGVVSSIPAEYQMSPRWRAFRRSYLSRNPNVTVPDNAAGAPLFVAYYDAAEALATALGRSHGGGDALRRELAATALESLAGPVRLDRNRQAVVSNYLVRFDPQSPSLLPTIRVVPNVEQSFGGYFTSRTPGPSLTAPGCHRAMPPPWARS